MIDNFIELQERAKKCKLCMINGLFYCNIHNKIALRIYKELKKKEK